MTQLPVHLPRLAGARFLWQSLRDPIDATRRNHAGHGPFVIFPHAIPFVRNLRLLVLTAGPAFNREVLSNPSIWRPIGIFPGGPRKSSARRLSAGLARMTGRRHAHYRRLLMPPLQKASVDTFSSKMMRLGSEEIATWPLGETIDLWPLVRRLMQTLGIGLLFGNDRKQAYPIAEMITHVLALKWSPSVWACPIDLPVTPYGQLMRESETLERCILEWAEQKRGQLDEGDLLSIIVNNPEEDGSAVRNETIVGQMPQLFGASFETCQNVLIWTLVLLAQHPRIAGDLLTELKTAFDGETPTIESIGRLALLDAVLKESLRILPPVPMQMRVAQVATSLAGYPVPKGTRVVLNAFLTNRMPERYSEPDCFRPERWVSLNPTPFEYLVFSAGPRNCPGYWLATAMMKVTLATILTRYRIELAQGSRVDYTARPALVPRGKVQAILHRQDGRFTATPIGGNIISVVQSFQ